MDDSRKDFEMLAKLGRQKHAMRIAICDAMAVLNVAQQPGYNAKTIAGEVVSNLKLEIDAIDIEDAQDDLDRAYPADEPEEDDINF